jgi:hypothetical protein
MEVPWKNIPISDFWENGIDLGDLFSRVHLIANGGINVKSPLTTERYIRREVDSTAMDPREVIPAPILSSYPGRGLHKIEWHWRLISELAHSGKYYFSERPRSPMAARGVTPAQTKRSEVSRRHDAGSHSVDRIVRIFCFFTVWN